MSEIAKQKEAFEAKIREYVGAKEGSPMVGEDLVNEPMIRHWCEVLGDENPACLDPDFAKDSVHGGIVAPPTMLQAWVMVGYPMHDPALAKPNKQNELHALFDEHGYRDLLVPLVVERGLLLPA